MYINHLALKNFRTYKELELPLKPGVSVFVGRNGEGKTNIVESILYLSFLSSHRTAGDQPLVTLGEQSAYIRATAQHPEREILVELEINVDKANRARINKNPTRSQKEIFGIVQSIYFSPEDMDLVRGDPSERRRFIDNTLVLRSPRLAGVISDYERALKQRNALLKTRASQSSLEPWDAHVAKFGAEIVAARLTFLKDFNPVFKDTYFEISPTKPAYIEYKSSTEGLSESVEENQQILVEKIKTIRHQEIERGLTLVGPHRDDLSIYLGDHLVKGYASHGESWSVALSLKLAAYKLLVAQDIHPILILDDVFSELDEGRREQLVNLANSTDQTLITVAVESDLPPGLNATTYYVKNGSVKVKP